MSSSCRVPLRYEPEKLWILLNTNTSSPVKSFIPFIPLFQHLPQGNMNPIGNIPVISP